MIRIFISLLGAVGFAFGILMIGPGNTAHVSLVEKVRAMDGCTLETVRGSEDFIVLEPPPRVSWVRLEWPLMTARVEVPSARQFERTAIRRRNYPTAL